MKSLKSFVLGFIIALVLCTTSITYADTIQKTIDVVLNSINISINNKQAAKIGDNYTLSNGNEVPYSISYKGTTYLPIRKVADLLNKEIIWDQETKTAKINDKADAVLPQKEEENNIEPETKPNDDKTKPKVIDIDAKSGTKIEIVFSEEMDKTTACDTSNYTIAEKYGSKKEIDIKKAELDDTNKKVILTTYGQKGKTLYSAEISKVADLAGNEMDSAIKVFVGLESGEEVADKVEISDGEFDVVKIETISTEKIEIQFNKYLDNKTVEKLSNYSIKEKYSNEALAIYDADIDKTGTRVVLLTAEQKGATIYNIEMSDIKDIDGNSLNKTQTFVGKGDTSNPFTIKSVNYISSNQVEIIFDIKAEEDTVENTTNYTINEKYGDKTVVSVKTASYNSSDKKVILTTSDMKENILYEIKIENINSAYGQVLKTSTYTFVKQ